jgi:prepilin-type N-terminal cleavage/methylation domain-containing protein
MKPELQAKFLQFISSKKNKNNDKGFTLIELLVVVIIIGVLAAVALPNLLGQVGKARETEGKNGVGNINRAQQSFHVEKGAFSADLTNAGLQANNALGVVIPASKYYDFAVTGGSATLASVTAIGKDTTGTADNGNAQGTRDFMGQTEFDSTAGAYGQIICQADVSGTANATAAAAGIATVGTTAGTGCTAGDTEIK